MTVLFKRTSLSLAIMGLSSLPVSVTPVFAEQQRVLEEVTVTAQRVEESIQDVPIAVSALTGDMMEDKGVLTPSDLQMSAPSVSFTATNFGGSSFSIRGIGNLVIGGESGVSTHVNEIAVGTNLNSAEFYDMERVEVLRGPQGTLFGRNATGGAINFVTKRPDFDSVGGFLDLEAGDYNNFRMKGALNIPLSDTFAVRFAGMDLSRDGYTENLAAGQVGVDGNTLNGIDDDVDGRDITTFRVTAEWAISDNANLWVMYYDFDEDDDRTRIINQVCVTNPIPTTGCLPDAEGFEKPHLISTTGGIIAGISTGFALLPAAEDGTQNYPRPQLGLRTMHTDFEPIFKDEEQLWAFGFAYDMDSYSFSLQGAYQEREYVAQQDYNMDVGPTLGDGSIDFPTSRPAGGPGGDWTNPNCNYLDGTAGLAGGCVTTGYDGTRIFTYDSANAASEYWTVEGKVQSSFDGAFNFVLGGMAYEGEGYGDYYVLANTLELAGAYPGFFNNTDEPNQPTVSDGWAVFGETYFDVTDEFRITVGLRYNEDHREDYGTNTLFNSADLNGPNILNGALGAPTYVRTGLIGFAAGAPLGDQTALAQLYGVTAAQISAAEATGAFSAERLALALTVPPVPRAAETRYLTGSPTEFDFNEFSGRVGFDWALNENTMVYSFVSRGYKPGGLNPAIPVDFQSTSKFSFDSEEITAFEFGTKNTLLDGTMILNGSFFYYDYSGLQVTRIVNNSSINENIDANIWGLELEGLWRPSAIPNLALNYAYSYINTEVDGSTSVDPVNRTAGNPDWILLNNIDSGAATGVNYIARRDEYVANGGAACGVAIPSLSYADGTPALNSRNCLAALGITTSDGLPSNLDGNELPNTPEHNISIGAAYTWDIPALSGALTARWDYYWQGDSYAREFNTVGDQIDSWDQHNAQLIYESTDGHWSGRLFVRNLQDEDNVTGKYLTSDTSGFYRNYFLTEPRIYGLSVRYDFSPN